MQTYEGHPNKRKTLNLKMNKGQASILVAALGNYLYFLREIDHKAQAIQPEVSKKDAIGAHRWTYTAKQELRNQLRMTNLLKEEISGLYHRK